MVADLLQHFLGSLLAQQQIDAKIQGDAVLLFLLLHHRSLRTLLLVLLDTRNLLLEVPVHKLQGLAANVVYGHCRGLRLLQLVHPHQVLDAGLQQLLHGDELGQDGGGESIQHEDAGLG